MNLSEITGSQWLNQSVWCSLSNTKNLEEHKICSFFVKSITASIRGIIYNF